MKNALILFAFAAALASPSVLTLLPERAEPLALVGEFALAVNAPDRISYYTPQGGMYIHSDSLAVEWEMRRLRPDGRFMNVYLSQGTEQQDTATIYPMAPGDTLVLDLTEGRWYLAVEDTAYGLSGFTEFVANPCTTTCFELPPSMAWRATPRPVYRYLGGREPALSFPDHELDIVYYDQIGVRELGEGRNYLRFAAYDEPTRSWAPFGGLIVANVLPCGWVGEAPTGPKLTRAWFANGWTFRWAWEDSLGSETSSIDPTTVQPADLALTRNGAAVPITSMAFHWGWYWSSGITQQPGSWKLRVRAGGVADTAGTFNSLPDSVEWTVP